MAEDEWVLKHTAPPDITFKCHPREAVKCVICAVCRNVYHKIDYAKKDIQNYVDSLYVICEDHEIENITSNPLDPRVANVILQNEVEKWRKKYNLVQEKYEVLKESYETIKDKSETTKKNYIDTKQKLKQAEIDLKQIKLSDTTVNQKLIIENQDLLTEIQIQDNKNGELTIENKHQKEIIKEITDKNEILKVLNKELIENNNLLKIKGKEQSLAGHTYAQITGKLVNKSNNNIPDIIIKPKNKEDLKKIFEETKTTINKNTTIPINKILSTKDKIIIKCKNKQDVNKMKLKLGTYENTEVEIEELKKPRIKIIGVDNEYQEESNQDIEVDIKSRNEITGNMELNIVHKYINNKNKSTTLIAEVNADTYTYIMREKKIYVGASRCRVYDDFNISMCHKCKTYGHNAKKCKGDYACLHCSEKHEEKICDQKNIQCINCTNYNKKNQKTQRNTQHAANNWSTCESYKNYQYIMIQKTDYPYDPLKANESYHKKPTLSTKKPEDNLSTDMSTTTHTTSDAGNSKKQNELIETNENLEDINLLNNKEIPHANNLLNNKEIPFKSYMNTRGRTLLTTRKFPEDKIIGDNQTLKNTKTTK